MFIPGETISHEFHIPFVQSDGIRVIYVTYKQNDDVFLIKEVYPGQITEELPGSHFTVTLSQQESLLFQNNSNFYVQLNVLFESGARSTSVALKGTNEDQHLREVVS